MRETAKALKTFFGGFGIPAYSETSVPDEQELPYITFPVREPEWNQKATMYCILWCRTKAYAQALEKADQILAAIGESKKIEINGGYVVLYPENPIFQEESDPDNDTKALYINLSMNAYHVAGI